MIKKHIGVFRQVSLGATDEKVAKAQLDIDKRAASLESYWKYFAGHVWDVKAVGYVIRSTENPHSKNFARSDIATFIANNDMEGFDPNYLSVRGGYSVTRCGEAQLGGKRSVAFINPICHPKTLHHEIGHNFGCMHAGALRGTVLSKMGDHTSIMSITTSLRGMNSPHLVMLGLADVYTITSTQQVLLTPTELSPRSLRENERQHVRVGTYYLSLRKNKGCQYPSGMSNREKLYIHKREKDENTVRLMPDLLPGQSKTLPNGARVEYLKYQDETARVNVYRGDAEPNELSMPIGFAPAPDNITAEHSGAYWHPDYVGQGLHVLHKDGKTVIYWYTFNEFDHSRRFYIASGEGNEFDLLTMLEGTWGDPTKARAEKVGTCQLYFDDGVGVFSYNTVDFGRGSIEFTQNALSAGEAWYQPDRSGEGFSLVRYGDTTVVYWYSYGPKPRMAYGSKSIGTQRWYVCSGTDELTIYEIRNGKWVNNLKTDKTAVGTATLTPDGDKMVFKYELDADRVSGSGEYRLERLF